MISYNPDRRSLTILQVAVIAAIIILIIAVRFFIKIYWLRMMLSIVFAVAALIADFIYLPLYFSNLRYCATNSEIKKCSGVLFKTSQTIKYSSIQYSTIITTPFSKYTGLNFAVFYVYGGKFLMLFLKSGDLQDIIKKSESI